MVVALDMEVSQLMDEQVIVLFPIINIMVGNIHGELVALTGPVSATE
jgi:hypothetical protein